MRKKILFLIPYPLHESPSQRFRFEQYFRILEIKGYSVTIHSFLNIHNWRVFYSHGGVFAKLGALLSGFGKRIIATAKSPMYDFVFIHREVTPVGPPVFEWILAKLLRRKIIYDFDDAIWTTDKREESFLLKAIKWRSKVPSMCKWAYKVSCGNDYLCAYASRYNSHVVLNPTTIDTETLHNPFSYNNLNQDSGAKIHIGWTGSHSTLKYLEHIAPILKRVTQDFPAIEFVIIADKEPILNGISNLKFVKWNQESEIADLLQFDIGIMPLPDDQWSKGKCGFKALQYMALEIPAVVSQVGVNTNIVDHGVNGFLCSTPEEWHEALSKLIGDPGLRKRMGVNGRKKVTENYSVLSNTSNFLSLFE